MNNSALVVSNLLLSDCYCLQRCQVCWNKDWKHLRYW